MSMGQLEATTPARPNVVFILVDDLGWSDTTLYNTTSFYRTPNIQRLAQRGMLFDRAYSSSPLCSPTRASIMTGQAPARTGITAPNCHVREVILQASRIHFSRAKTSDKTLQCISATRLNTTHVTLAEKLKSAGYATGHFGKWHLGLEPYSPLQHGFDVDVPHFPGPGPTSQGKYIAPWYIPGLVHRVSKEHLEDRMAEEAISFIENNKNRPFFLNYWSFSVHSPFEAKTELINKYRAFVNPSNPQRSPTYASMVETLDTNIGKLMDTLDRLNLTSKTVVVFMSDNGGNMYDTVDSTTPTSNAPLRGGKGCIFEGGTRVPCVVSWPGVTSAGSRSSQPIQSIDFYPTILGLLGISLPTDTVMDGINISEALQGRSLPARPLFNFFPFKSHRPEMMGPSVSVTLGDWKLIRIFHDAENFQHRYLLYNLRNDAGEMNNLAAQNPTRVRDLDTLITNYLTNARAVLPTPNPRYVPPTLPPI